MLEEFLFPISWNSGNAKDSDQGSGITPINRDLESKKIRAILVILAPIILTGIISLFCWKLFAVRTYQPGPGIYPIRLMSSFNIRSAKWSPDGERIAVITTKRGDQTSPTEIYLLDWRSETSERIPTVTENVSQERMDISQIDWAPDGKTLGFFGIPTDPKQQGIWLVNLENNQMRFFAKGNRFSWSPTGDRIAVLNEPDAYSFAIKVIDLQTNEERLVLEFQHQEASTQMGLDWAPIGDKLLVTVPGVNPDGYRLDGLYVLELDNSSFYPILGDSVWSLYHPAWLPNGKWLTSIAITREGGTVVVAPETGECLYAWLPQLQKAEYVDVLPDGRKLLVISRGDLYIVDIEKAMGTQRLPEQLQCFS